MDSWVPTISVKAILTGLEALGLERKDLFPSALLQKQLGDPYAAVPDGIFGEVWARAFALTPDPTLATRAAFALPYGEFGLLDHLVTTATTSGEALHMLNVFLWLVSTGIWLEFDHAADDWLWVLSDPASDFVSTEWTLALIYSRMKSGNSAFKIAEVHLSGAADPESAAAFRALWGVPVRLKQKKTGFRLAKGVWQTRNEQANPDLQTTLKGLAERIDIRQFTAVPLTYMVKSRRRGGSSTVNVPNKLRTPEWRLPNRAVNYNVVSTKIQPFYRKSLAVCSSSNAWVTARPRCQSAAPL